jgi:hypothetical protein
MRDAYSYMNMADGPRLRAGYDLLINEEARLPRIQEVEQNLPDDDGRRALEGLEELE